MKKPLEPLIPLDELKNVVSKLIAVSKDTPEKAKAERSRRKRGKKTA